MERKDVGNSDSGNEYTEKSHSGRAGVWDRGRAPEAGRNTHPPGSWAGNPLSARARRQGKRAADCYGRCQRRLPKGDQGCPSAEGLERGLGAGCAEAREPGQSPSLCSERRREAILGSIMGCTGRFGEGLGGGSLRDSGQQG